MLTTEEKRKLIDHQVKEYEVKIFTLQMNRTALDAVGDTEGCTSIDARIEALRKGIAAVSAMEV